MLVMTAKIDMKKIAIGIIAAIALIAAIIMLFSKGDDVAPTAATIVSNDDRVNFLKSFGWDVTVSPTESGQVRIPAESTEVYDRYNKLQQSQGYDLTPYAGKSVMRYVYKINNYPGASDPVYATLLIHKNQIIGGDITNSAAQGSIHGFQVPGTTPPSVSAPEETVPTTT